MSAVGESRVELGTGREGIAEVLANTEGGSPGRAGQVLGCPSSFTGGRDLFPSLAGLPRPLEPV